MSAKAKMKKAAHSDEAVAVSIRHAWSLDSDVPDNQITVQVNHGMATLEGNVATTLAREAAEADARKVKGVREIANRLHVSP